jgi:hypothetical protein
LTISPIFLFLLSSSDLGIGYRHLFPMFPMLYILIGGCADYVLSKNPKYTYGFASKLLWQLITTVTARPGLLATRMRRGEDRRRRICTSPTPMWTGASNSKPSNITLKRIRLDLATLRTSHKVPSILGIMESTAECYRQDQHFGRGSILCASAMTRTYRAPF